MKSFYLTFLLAIFVWSAAGPRAQDCAKLDSSVIAWWPANGDAKDTVSATSATIIGGVTFAQGKIGKAFLFDGTGEVIMENRPVLNPTRLTIEGWVYPTRVDGDVDIILNKEGSSVTPLQYEVGIRGTFRSVIAGTVPTGNFVFYLGGVSGLPDEYSGFVDSAANIPLNTWTHVALTYDGSSAVTYVNGVATRRLNGLSGSVLSGPGPLKIGARSPAETGRVPTTRFNGLIDEMAVYNAALSGTQIAAIHAAGASGQCDGSSVSKPSILTDPASLMVRIGEKATFSVIADGTPPLRYQWYKNGNMSLSGQTNSTLVFQMVTSGDAGTYGVVVSNNVGGAVSAFATLSLGAPPRIVTQPVARTVTEGSSASFSVTVDGSLPLRYQWRLNGQTIPNATNATLSLTNLQLSQSGGNYSVRITNNEGSVESGNVTLTVVGASMPPTIIAQPNSQNVLEGATAVLEVVLSGSPPFNYQWLLDGALIANSNTNRLVRTNAQVSMTGLYHVIISNARGSVVSTAATLIVSPANKVERLLPAGYVPGQPLTVAIRVLELPGRVYAVEDTIPTNWVTGSISDGGRFDPATRKVKFGPFFDNTPRNFNYQATPPLGDTGTKLFSGTISIDGQSAPIGGNATIASIALHPADNKPADSQMMVDEVTAYGAAWRGGASWPKGPNPIPVDYVTRASMLWLRGETYVFDGSLGTPPVAWTPVLKEQQSLRAAVPLTPSVAVREAPVGLAPGRTATVVIRVIPGAGVSSYAVEEDVPAGSTVAAVSAGAEVDRIYHKVKWGPFYDSAERTFSYQLVPDAAGSVITFAGRSSYDGVNETITGTSSSRVSVALSATMVSEGKVGFVVGGFPGQRCRIETSTDLADWTEVQTLTIPPEGGAEVIVPTTEPAQFYRVLLLQ